MNYIFLLTLNREENQNRMIPFGINEKSNKNHPIQDYQNVKGVSIWVGMNLYGLKLNVKFRFVSAYIWTNKDS